MKLWIDEDLSPTLVQVANRVGHWATCNRDRGHLGVSDEFLLPIVHAEDCVFVTGNRGDFVALTEAEDIHPGLVLFPNVLRADQQRLFAAVLHYIEDRAGENNESPADFMTNRVVEMEEDGSCTDDRLP